MNVFELLKEAGFTYDVTEKIDGTKVVSAKKKLSDGTLIGDKAIIEPEQRQAEEIILKNFYDRLINAEKNYRMYSQFCSYASYVILRRRFSE